MTQMCNGGLSRRNFLKLSGISAMSVGGMLVLTGCGPSTDSADAGASASDAAAAFGDGGKLRIGMEVAYPPYNYQVSEASEHTIPVEGQDGAFADGYDVYVGKKVGEAFDLEPVAVKLAWSGLIEALSSGKIDCIIAGMTATDERKQSIDFSEPYFVGYYGLLVKKDSPYANATSFADFNGAAVLGQKDTLLDSCIDEIEGVNHLTPVDSVPAQLSHLNQGACDAITYNVENRETLLETNPDLVAVTFDGKYELFPDAVGCSVGIAKGKDDVVRRIDEVVTGISDEERQEAWDGAVARQPE